MILLNSVLMLKTSQMITKIANLLLKNLPILDSLPITAQISKQYTKPVYFSNPKTGVILGTSGLNQLT